jgi:C-terminal processing protease CtpA/Prc
MVFARRSLRKVSYVAVLFASFSGWAREATAQSSCSTLGQTSFVRDVLNEYYLWYQKLPSLNPALYDSPEAYLEAVRYRPLDNTYSYITLRSTSDAFYSDSQYIGIGISTKLVSDTDYRVTEVYPDSPASEAGMSRGDRIVEINGRAVADLLASGELGGAFGPSEIGVSASVKWRTLGGDERQASVTKRLVTIPTVSLTKVFDVSGRRVGYVVFRNFVQPSTAALNEAFAQLAAAGASELVLDLRYNGGGLVSVAQHLASLIGGNRTTAQVFAQYVHNDKNAHRNQVLRFSDAPNALNLERLFVITSRASASASELIINSLRPFIPVVTVGDTTYGKPVGQYGFNFCDKVLYPVAFSAQNARGEADFYDGFAPDCPAGDEVEKQFGDPAEASLAGALAYAQTGSCAAGARAFVANKAEHRRLKSLSGWQQVLGAY